MMMMRSVRDDGRVAEMMPAAGFTVCRIPISPYSIFRFLSNGRYVNIFVVLKELSQKKQDLQKGPTRDI